MLIWSGTVTRLIMMDLDETLVDREAALRNWIDALAASVGADSKVRQWLIDFDKDRDDVRERGEFLAAVAERLGLPDSAEKMMDRWVDDFASHYRLDNATRCALMDARAAGCRLAVVTNGGTRRQTAKLDGMGITDLVDACVISEAAGVEKPKPAIFELAAEQAGADLDDAWMMGDSAVADIGGAWSVGATPLWVNLTCKVWPDGHRRAVSEFGHPAPAIRYILAH